MRNYNVIFSSFVLIIINLSAHYNMCSFHFILHDYVFISLSYGFCKLMFPFNFIRTIHYLNAITTTLFTYYYIRGLYVGSEWNL